MTPPLSLNWRPHFEQERSRRLALQRGHRNRISECDVLKLPPYLTASIAGLCAIVPARIYSPLTDANSSTGINVDDARGAGASGNAKASASRLIGSSSLTLLQSAATCEVCVSVPAGAFHESTSACNA